MFGTEKLMNLTESRKLSYIYRCRFGAFEQREGPSNEG